MPMNEDLLGYIFLGLIILALFFCVWQAQIVSDNNRIASVQNCREAGYITLEEKATMQQLVEDVDKNKFFAEERLAIRSRAFSKIMESVFYTEKLSKEYATFSIDLNLCERFCYD